MNKKIRFAISFLIVVLALTACNQSYKTSEGDGNHFSQTEKTNAEIQPNTAAMNIPYLRLLLMHI